MPDFTEFRVLLDDPAAKPALGFSGYADSLAEVVLHSDAQFAIGIFGEWGSGKTTLMRALEDRLKADPMVVTVWFNAWRYEREAHLMVPLLDSLRDSLVEWSEAQQDGEEQHRARRAAAGIARAARALLAGMSVSGAVPGLKFSVDGERILENLQAEGEDEATAPQSFYHAGFKAMRATVRQFAFNDPRSDRRVDRRVVVFVDDLDRCLPASALEVLEAMKVLFDLEGFVFVVGLAQSVIDEAVRIKYADLLPADEQVRGTEYSKKLFQVPFSLPRIRTDQLMDYFHSLVQHNDLSIEQRQDLNMTVAPHLPYLSGDDTVNPREVKRFINSYTLQMKMLRHRLGMAVNPEAVLALQVLAFRPDWRDLYDSMALDPAQFREAVREAMDTEGVGRLWVGTEDTPLPVSFMGYLQGVGAPLMAVADLGPYVTSAEFTRSTDPDLLEAQAAVRTMRRTLADLSSADQLSSESISTFRHAVELLSSRSADRTGPLARDLSNLVDQLRRSVTELRPDAWESVGQTWLSHTGALVTQLDQTIAELRRLARGAVST